MIKMIVMITTMVKMMAMAIAMLMMLAGRPNDDDDGRQASPLSV